jgi:transposase
MQTVTTIGFDIAKSVFQVHGVDAAGQVVVRRQLKRRQVIAFFRKLPPCSCCERCRPQDLPIRPQLLSLDRTGA